MVLKVHEQMFLSFSLPNMKGDSVGIVVHVTRAAALHFFAKFYDLSLARSDSSFKRGMTFPSGH